MKESVGRITQHIYSKCPYCNLLNDIKPAVQEYKKTFPVIVNDKWKVPVLCVGCEETFTVTKMIN